MTRIATATLPPAHAGLAAALCAPARMVAVTSVQRLNTEGGNAPATGCATPADAGKRVKQGYTADYVFFTAGNA
jgi:hypothetical protein